MLVPSAISDRPLDLVIVSPHFDDGVLSVGAGMASWARAGHRVTLLTVLGCDRDSSHAAGGWDLRGGYGTEGDAARGRREEDRRACTVLGIAPVWFPFGSSDYDRRASDHEVWAAISPGLVGADVVIGPGSPLTHPDHMWLSELLSARVPEERLALYAEQPYTLRNGSRPYASVGVSARDRLAKWRAVRAYRSQLPLLDIPALRGAAALARADELVAWPQASSENAS